VIRVGISLMSQSFRPRPSQAVLALALAAALVAPQAGAETLADAVAEAYQSNPSLEAQRANLRALDETYVQARAGWRPTLNFTAQAVWQETHNTAALVANANPFSPLLPIQRQNYGVFALNFSQPIWTGGRVAAEVTATNADVLQGREQLRQTEAQVLQQVISAYADVLRDQQGVATQQQYENLLETQLREDQARFDVGTDATRTDVAQSQSRLAAAQGALQSAMAQLDTDRATYAAVVGHNPGDLAPLPSLAYLVPANVDDAFTIAEQNSPQLRAQLYAEQASRARIARARADRMPTLSFNASEEKANGAVTPFNSDLYQHIGQAYFTLTVPLFNGGATTSGIRQAIERNNSDRISIEAQRRQVLQTISQAWAAILANRANISATEEQVRAANVAYEGMHEEEKAGLRSTLDVLIAAQDLSNARLSQANAQHDEFVDTAALLAVVGRLEARDLIPSQPRYDPKANFRRLRFSLGWVPWEEPIDAVDRFATFPETPRSHELSHEPAIGPGLQPAPSGKPVKPAS